MAKRYTGERGNTESTKMSDAEYRSVDKLDVYRTSQ